MQLNRTADLEFIQIQGSEQNPWVTKQFAFVKDTWVLSSSDIKKQYTVNIWVQVNYKRKLLCFRKYSKNNKI